MATIQPRQLRQRADEILQSAGSNPRKLILQHTAIALGSALLVTALNFILSNRIEVTGGLAGMGMRSVLTTVQTVLQFAVSVLLPFWEIGVVYAALRWAREEQVKFPDVCQGFRRFGPVLSLKILQGAILLALGMAASYISTVIFAMTPYAQPVMELLEPMLDELAMQPLEELLTPELMTAISRKSVPMFIIMGVLFAVLGIPLFYRLRFAEFVAVENGSGLMSVLQSIRVTKGSCLQLVKLDLSFWWYYLLQLVFAILCYGDIICDLLGITLPFSADTGFFLFYIVGILGQGILLWSSRAKVMAVYGLAFRELNEKPLTPRAESLPHTVPWDA